MKTLIQAAVVTLFASSAAQAQQAVQWRVQDGGNGHWYQRTSVAMPWVALQSWCTSQGGHLATLTSAPEGTWVKNNLPVVECFIGGFQDVSAPDYAEPLGGWRWVTNEPFQIIPSFMASFDDCPGGSPGSCGCGTAGAQNVLFFSGCCGVIVDDVGDGIIQNCDSNARFGIIEWSADCNNDGIVDYGQILDGTFPDQNTDGVPDVCQQAPCTPSDLTANGVVDGADLGALLAFWGPVNPVFPQADIDRNGIVNGADLGTLLANWGPCGAPAWATVISWLPDPAVVTDGQLRAGIQATGLPWRVRDTGTGIEMLLVPPGTFNMGCSASDQYACASDGRESPVHAVTLTNAFYLGRYEVTQAQWTAVMGSNPSSFQSASAEVPAGQVPLRPVEGVSWNMIQGFNTSTGLRLPTEAEWEYAYRAGTATAFHLFSGYPNGTDDDTLLGNIAWFYPGAADQTRPVGGKQANALGLHDMSGNVWEWVNDWYGSTYYESSPSTNPPGPATGTSRVLRGGSWFGGSCGGRSSNRVRGTPADVSYYGGGFRVARTP